jgi:hypothetical protein
LTLQDLEIFNISEKPLMSQSAYKTSGAFIELLKFMKSGVALQCPIFRAGANDPSNYMVDQEKFLRGIHKRVAKIHAKCYK